MSSFIKCCSLPDLKNKMIILYVFNVTDILFTLLLCSTGCFMEANPLVSVFIDSTVFSLLVKLALPAALIAYLYIRMKKANESQLKKANMFIITILLVYAVINVSHIIWISVYYAAPSLLY